MARSIATIHDTIKLLTRKEKGAYHTPVEIDYALEAGQLEFLKECLKNKDWSPIEVFKVTNASFTSNATGGVTFPDGYVEMKGIFCGTVASPVIVRLVCEDELPDALKSQLRPVSATKPVGVTTANGIQLYPETTYTGKVTYYRLPATPKYAYSIVGRAVTYNNSSSVQLEVEDIHVDKVIGKALAILGVNMDEKDIIEFGNYKEQTA